jgi:phage baseplate assembly protein W
MSDFEDRLGIDLILLRDRRNQAVRDRGRDLAVAERPGTGGIDLDTLRGKENIAQALLLRFLTAEGELALLGHPRYGSRLGTLIGKPNTEANRGLVKLYALRAVQREPRVEKVLSANVRQRADDRGRVDIDLRLKILDTDSPLNLVVPFFFDSGATP